MSEWNKYSLEDLAFYYNGKAFKPSDWKKAGVKIIRIEQLNNPDGFYDFYQGEFPEINKIENGDLIFSWSATLKVLIWKHGNAVLNQHLFKVVPKQFVDKYFLFFLLDYNMEKIGDTSHGSTMKHIKRGELGKFFVFAPGKPTQHQIALILTTCDAVIEKTQATIAKYKAIKQGMLHDLFTRGVDLNTGRLRPKYEDTPVLYKESRLGMVPREWEEKKIGEICSMKSGEGITSKSIYEIEDYPVYGGNGLRGFTSSYTHEGEYILVGRQGALCGNITRVRGKFYASEHAVVVTVENEINVDWLSQQLEDKNLNQYSEASAQPGLSVNKILKLPIIKPQFEEQNKIAERLLSIDDKLHTEQNYLHKLQHMKAGLMGDLLNGRKRVTVPEEVLTQTEN